MTVDEFEQSVEDASPPAGIGRELEALWLAKKGRWEDSHSIAQDIDTSMGSWIHALLHAIEGDPGNAGYWYSRAGRPAIEPTEIDREWRSIAGELLGGD